MTSFYPTAHREHPLLQSLVLSLPDDINLLIKYFTYQAIKRDEISRRKQLSPLCNEIKYTFIGTQPSRRKGIYTSSCNCEGCDKSRLMVNNNARYFNCGCSRYFYNRKIFNDDRFYVPETDTIKMSNVDFKNILLRPIYPTKIIRDKINIKMIDVKKLKKQKINKKEKTLKFKELYTDIHHLCMKYISMTDYKKADMIYGRNDRIETILDKCDEVYTYYGYNYNICKNGNPEVNKCFKFSFYDTQKIYGELIGDKGDNCRINTILNAIDEEEDDY